MVTPPLHIIQNTTSSYRGVIYNSSHPTIQLGYFSKPEELKFDYRITKYQGDELHLQLCFEEPIHVSKHYDSLDQLNITFYGWMFYFSTDGLYIPENRLVTKNLPTMFQVSGCTETTDHGSGLVSAFQTFMVLNLLLNFFLSASLKRLLGMLYAYQIILFMPLFMLSIPGDL
jgi:hypothetical protein